MRWLMDLWRWQQRRTDLRILWPTCKEQARGDLVMAKAAFALHCFHDPAWLCLGDEEIRCRIDDLD